MLHLALPFALAALVAGGFAAAQTTSVLSGGGVTESALIDALAPPAEAPRTRGINRNAAPPAAPKPAKAALLITFQTNSTALTPQARRELDIVGRALNTQKLQEYVFAIEGHADPRGSPEANLKLSQGRAEAVVQYLVSAQSVRPERLKAIGKGDREPLDPANPAAPENRRITFVNTFQTLQ
jgi:outer membrane protein OmpA-like peptidoglycan-associated protein